MRFNAAQVVYIAPCRHGSFPWESEKLEAILFPPWKSNLRLHSSWLIDSWGMRPQLWFSRGKKICLQIKQRTIITAWKLSMERPIPQDSFFKVGSKVLRFDPNLAGTSGVPIESAVALQTSKIYRAVLATALQTFIWSHIEGAGQGSSLGNPPFETLIY